MSDGKCKLARGTTVHAWYFLLDDTLTFDRQIRQISPVSLSRLSFACLPSLTTLCAERISSWLVDSVAEL
jgi:hypothetical protein